MTGAILAGGSSNRMGKDKALLEVGGERMIERTVALFNTVFSNVLVVTPRPADYAYLGVRLVSDLMPGRGALGGLHAALSWAPATEVFIVACDMPLLNSSVIELMINQSSKWDVVVPRVAKGFEPLHARYSRNCIRPIEEMLLRGSRKVTDFYRRVRVKSIPEEDIRFIDPQLLSFRNINTPEDLDAIRSMT